MRFHFLERLPVAAAPLRIGLHSDHLGGDEPAAWSVTCPAVVLALTVPAISPDDAGLHRYVDEDALNLHITRRAQFVDPPFGGCARRHGDIPDDVLAICLCAKSQLPCNI